MLTRRTALAAGLAAAHYRTARAEQPSQVNLAFQKTGIPLLARQRQVYERRLEPLGIKVNWVEFLSGLLLLQAMDQGSVDFGNAGDVGTLFVQASGGAIAYVAAQPTAPHAEGILVKDGSPIRQIADLKGKRVAVARGSSSRNVVIAALESAGLSITDIEIAALGAPDASFAFSKGAVDAWVVWDPFFTMAQTREPIRVIAYTGDVLKGNASFLLASRRFADRYPAIVSTLVEGAAETGAWANEHPLETAAALAAATGIDPAFMEVVGRNA